MPFDKSNIMVICCFPHGYVKGEALWENVINYGFTDESKSEITFDTTLYGMVSRKLEKMTSGYDFIRALDFKDLNMNKSMSRFLSDEKLPPDILIVYDPSLSAGKEITLRGSHIPLICHAGEDGILRYNLSLEVK